MSHVAVSVRRAVPADADAIVALRDDAARWQLSRGIRQWVPGEVSRDDVIGWLSGGRLYVAEADRELAGAVRLTWSDPEVWPGADEDDDAAYVHALVSSRAPHARGVGRLLLAHVEGIAAAAGRSRMRLSCLHGNPPLERFYLGAGYTIVGRQDFPDHPGWDPVTLLEKQLPAAARS
jgi:protein-tyrosine phosphatase